MLCLKQCLQSLTFHLKFPQSPSEILKNLTSSTKIVNMQCFFLHSSYAVIDDGIKSLFFVLCRYPLFERQSQKGLLQWSQFLSDLSQQSLCHSFIHGGL